MSAIHEPLIAQTRCQEEGHLAILCRWVHLFKKYLSSTMWQKWLHFEGGTLERKEGQTGELGSS